MRIIIPNAVEDITILLAQIDQESHHHLLTADIYIQVFTVQQAEFTFLCPSFFLLLCEADMRNNDIGQDQPHQNQGSDDAPFVDDQCENCRNTECDQRCNKPSPDHT